jgi:phage-related protein
MFNDVCTAILRYEGEDLLTSSDNQLLIFTTSINSKFDSLELIIEPFKSPISLVVSVITAFFSELRDSIFSLIKEIL